MNADQLELTRDDVRNAIDIFKLRTDDFCLFITDSTHGVYLTQMTSWEVGQLLGGN